MEAVETAKGISPALGIDPGKPAYVQPLYGHSGEYLHIAELARSRHTPFIGGEPTAAAIMQELQKQGYSAKEGMALYLMREIPCWRRDGLLKDKQHFAVQAHRVSHG